MTNIGILYVAAFFDAEGYVGVRYTKTTGYHVFQVSITNNHKGVLEEIQKAVGGTLIAPKNYGVKAGKTAWVLSFYSGEAITFLDTIYPYLIVKKEQVKIALQYPLNELKLPLTEEMKQTRQSIMEQLKVLKRSYIDVPDDWQSTKKVLEDEPIVQEAVRLYTEGMETKDIAEELGAKVNTVSYWLRTLKVNRSRKEVAERSALKQKNRIAIRPDAHKAVELFDEGLSIAEIANQLNKKYATVYHWLKKLGRHRTLEEAQQIRREREASTKPPKEPKPKKIPLEDRKDVKRAVELRKNDKLGYEKIAEIISKEFNQNCSQSHVGYWFSQLDLMGPANENLEEIKEIQRLYVEKEMSLRQVAKKMSKSVTFVQRHIKKAGLTRSLRDAHQLKLDKAVRDNKKKDNRPDLIIIDDRILSNTPKIDITGHENAKTVEWEKGIILDND